MKVLLIRPNSSLAVVPVPMGLGYLSHTLKTERGDATRILDARLLRASSEKVVRAADDYGPDFIGVTSMTFEAPEALELIGLLKKKLPQVPIALGGPHATGYGPSLLDKCDADYLVMGEGERTAVELLDALEGKRDLSSIKGLAFRADGQAAFNETRGPIDDMDGLEPDWDALAPERYFGWWTRNAMNTVARSNRRLPVFFSRGCPIGCSYCHRIFGRKYRVFSIEKTVASMLELRDRRGVREFEIIDDNFNLKLDHAKAVMSEIIGRRLGASLTFTNGLRADKMDLELLTLMKKAGVYRIDYAIESASPRVQKMVHKNLDLDRAREVVNQTAGMGFVTGAYYMLGFPEETIEEMETTVEYALSLQNHVSSFFYLMPFPGTEIAESSPEVARAARSTRFRDASGVVINLSSAPAESMEKLRRQAYRNFYFSPARIARILRDVPKNARLLASALAVIRLSTSEEVNY